MAGLFGEGTGQVELQLGFPHDHAGRDFEKSQAQLVGRAAVA